MVSVGIDIGTFSIKVAEVSPNGKTYDIIRFDEYPLSQDPNKDNEIEILEILREVSGRYAHDQTRFILGVRNEQVSVRRMFFPFKERHKIIKSLPFELEDEIPFSMMDAIFDAKVCRYLGDGAEVIAVTCPKDLIEDRIQKASDGQIQPQMISVDGLAFANMFEAWRESAPESEALDEDDNPAETNAEVVIEIGHSSSLVVVLRDNTLLEARTINWGGKNIAEAIAKKYAIHYVEALKEMRSKAFILLNNEGASADQLTMSDLVKKSVDEFSHSLALSLLEIKSEYNLKLTHCALVGGVSLIRNLGPYITQTIEVPTNRLAKIDRHPELNFSTNANNVTASLTALGLALEGIKKPKNPGINLLKDEFALQGQGFKAFTEKWGHTLAVAAAMFVVFFVWAVVRDNIAQTMSDKAYDKMKENGQKIAGLSRAKSNPRNIGKFIKKAKRKEKNRLMLSDLKEIDSALDVLNRVNSAAPPKSQTSMNVRKFRVDNNLVRIEGEMKKAQNISAFKRNIQAFADGPVKDRTVTIKPTKGFRAFHFEFKVNRKSGS